MDNQSLEERLQKNAKDIKGLRMFDDTFMSAVFDCQIEETECLLKIVLERDDLKVETTKTQYTIYNEYGHEVRLDIRATELRDRVRYLKETERGQLEVCELMERIVAEEVEKANEVQAK